MRKSSPAPASSANDLESEVAVVVRAVCATKLPTLTFEDVGRFKGLILDIFPGTQRLLVSTYLHHLVWLVLNHKE